MSGRRGAESNPDSSDNGWQMPGFVILSQISGTIFIYNHQIVPYPTGFWKAQIRTRGDG